MSDSLLTTGVDAAGSGSDAASDSASIGGSVVVAGTASGWVATAGSVACSVSAFFFRPLVFFAAAKAF